MLANPMLREKILQSHFMVSVGHYMKDYLVRRFGQQVESKILVIPYGIRLSLFHNDKPNGFASRSDVLHIVSVGNYVPKKGHEYLIDACAILKRRHIPFHCTIIGAGNREPYAQRVLAHELGTEVELCGIIQNEELPHRLKEADVFVLACVLTPSGDRDATPSVLKEALAVERPVISTPVSSIPELVEHGRTGLLVPPQDAQALADALELLSTNPELRIELGKRGRERVEQEFNVEHNVGRLATTIQEFLS
jgi:glycosyltransferase involved in cell wall biosynthesis